jgi:hypothetical protein
MRLSHTKHGFPAFPTLRRIFLVLFAGMPEERGEFDFKPPIFQQDREGSRPEKG